MLTQKHVHYFRVLSFITPRPSAAATAINDALVFTFSASQFTIITDKWPTLTALQLLGVLWGLMFGVVAVARGTHDLLDGLFFCSQVRGNI